MIEGFEKYLTVNNIYDEKVNVKVEKSFDLFRKYIRDIWW